MKIGFGRMKTETTVFEPFSKGPWEPEKALDFLSELSQCLSRSGISHWVTYGSLLGLVRQNSLLAWDNDIDIAIAPGATSEAVLTALRQAGLPVQMLRQRGGRAVSMKVRREGIRADLFLLASQGGALVEFGGTGGFVLTLTHPAMAVVEKSFAGRIFPVPAEPETYLAHLYGSKWRVPARNWDWRHASANRVALEFNSLAGLAKICPKLAALALEKLAACPGLAANENSIFEFKYL